MEYQVRNVLETIHSSVIIYKYEWIKAELNYSKLVIRNGHLKYNNMVGHNSNCH